MKRVLKLITKPFHYFNKLSKKKKVLVVIVFLILLAIISNQLFGNKKEEYSLVKVKKGSITEIVSEPGLITSSGTIDVNSPSAGIVEELYVSNGDSVTKGQTLFVVKSTATDADKATAYATYQSAVSSLTTAKQTRESLDAAMWAKQKAYLDAQNTQNYKDDNDKNPSTGKDYTDLENESIDSSVVVAQKDFKAAEKKYQEANIAVTAAEAQVNATLLSYQATQNATVKAQAEGTVANLAISQGDAVKAVTATTLQAGAQSSPVLSIVSNNDINVIVAIGQSDIAKIEQGQEVLIDPDAYNNKDYQGKVSRVDSIGRDVSGVVVYNIYVDIIDKDSMLRSGMTVDADVTTAEKKNVLIVPNSSIKPYKGKRAVRVVDTETNELKFIPVEVGIRGKTNSEIRDGLTEGQEIVSSLTNEQVDRPGGLF